MTARAIPDAYDECARCGRWHYTHRDNGCGDFVSKKDMSFNASRLWNEMNRQRDESSRPGWDDEQAVPTLPNDWDMMLAFAERAMREIPGLPVPSSAPCPDGTVHLSWYRHSTRVTFERRGEMMFYSTAIDGIYIDKEASEDLVLNVLREAFKE